MGINDVVILNIPKILDERGNLSFFQNQDQIPFEIQMVYWINNIPGNECLLGHANKEFQEVIIALSGSFEIRVHDGVKETRYTLNRPDVCLYIPRMIWRELVNFSTNSVAFITTDQHNPVDDRITDFQAYQSLKKNG